MDSTPHSTDDLSTSTPIQQQRTSRFGSCKRFLTSPVKGFDFLSPIKKIFPFRRSLFDNSKDTHVSTTKGNKKNQNFVYDFKLAKLSVNANDSYKFDNDSGIESDRSSITSEDQSLFDKLTAFPTDENCNVIINCDKLNDNSYQQLSECVGSQILLDSNLEYHKSKNLFEILDNRNKTSTTLQEKHNSGLIPAFDILSELNLRNCYGVLSLVLSYLPNEDLRKASCISKEWQDIVYSDKKANERRKAYIKKKKAISAGHEKENKVHSKHAAERNHKSAFLNVINIQVEEESQQPLTFTENLGKFDSFIKESQSLLEDGKLIKCPKCLYPAKAQSGNKFSCTRNLCQHIFCKKCMGPHLKNHHCSVPKLNITVPTVSIGSKQSKKNLRRL